MLSYQHGPSRLISSEVGKVIDSLVASGSKHQVFVDSLLYAISSIGELPDDDSDGLKTKDHKNSMKEERINIEDVTMAYDLYCQLPILKMFCLAILSKAVSRLTINPGVSFNQTIIADILKSTIAHTKSPQVVMESLRQFFDYEKLQEDIFEIDRQYEIIKRCSLE